MLEQPGLGSDVGAEDQHPQLQENLRSQTLLPEPEVLPWAAGVTGKLFLHGAAKLHLAPT